MNRQTSVQWRLTGMAALATLLTSLSLSPTLAEGNWGIRMIAVIAVIAGVGGVCRQLAAPRWLIPMAQAVALLLTLTVMFAREVAPLGVVPGPEVARRLVDLVGQGMTVTWNQAPPVSVTPGVALVVVGGVGVVAVAVDALAVNWRHATLAGLPLFILYLVPAAVLPDGVPWPLFALAAIGWILLQLADGRDRLSRWGKLIGTQSEATTGLHVIGGTGRRLGATALVAAVALPLILPSLTDGVFGAGGTDPDGSGSGGGSVGTQRVVTVNPIVDLRRNLTQGEDAVVMRYTTTDDSPEYFRIATLDEFDGTSWTLEDMSAAQSQQAADGLPLPPGLLGSVAQESVTTEVSVLGLQTPRLPLPYPVTEVDIEGDWRWDADTFDVFSAAEDGSAQGTNYIAKSLKVTPTTVQLSSAPAPEPQLDHYMTMPSDVRTMLQSTTEQVTAGAISPYDRALAIQNWFLSEFDYSTEAPAGNAKSDLAAFLEDQSGYCEQFAATMGLMARVAGIPSRVQVGFTPGSLIGDGTWEVTAHDAHAWPELWFQGVGWVRFEPTPGSGVDTDIATPAWAPPPVPVENPRNGTGNGNNNPGPTLRKNQPTRPDDRRLPTDPGGSRRGAAAGIDGANGADRGSGAVWGPYALAAMVMVGVAAVAPLTAQRLNRGRRWARATDGRTAALAAWQDILDAAIDLDLDPLPTETPRDLTRRLPRQGGLPQHRATEFAQLARTVERSRYAASIRQPALPTPLGDDNEIDQWREVSNNITEALRDAVAPRDRRRATWWPASGRAALALWWGESMQRLERGWGVVTSRLTRRTRRV